MDAQDRKLQQRLARRKERVQRLIADQEAKIARIKQTTYGRYQDYLRVKSQAVNKLRRLTRELLALEQGKLPGAYTDYPLSE